MQVPMKIHCFPVKLSGKDAVAIAAIFALETIIMTAMGNIYYRDFTDKDILQFEEYLNRIRVNLEEWSDK